MKELGGFNTDFWPGEDTIACLQITKELGKKIIYAPDALVYHHRRKLFIPHLRQIWSYALHRGYFVKRFPETSLSLTYFIPAFFVLGLIAGLVLSIFSPPFRIFFLIAIALYFLLILLESLAKVGLKMAPAVIFGIFLTHITYGVGFVKGLFARKLKEEF